MCMEAPIVQDYAYLSLTPISIEANLTNALSRQNIRVDVPCRFTVGISTEGESMNNAAERLLGLTPNDIQEMARDILFGQLRLVIASMSIEELNSDRDKFQENIMTNVEIELKKIGLKLINVNVTDIKDESGYIEALGKEAAAKAINEAKVSVAEQEKIGEIGRAEAQKETRKPLPVKTKLRWRLPTLMLCAVSKKLKQVAELWQLKRWHRQKPWKKPTLLSVKLKWRVQSASVLLNKPM